MRLADYIFTHLQSLGVDTVFMVAGGGVMHLCDAVATTNMNFVPHHNEQACSISAEAYARMNEYLGVALVTTGPGSTNAITGVAGAWIESVPLLVISGQVKRADMKKDTGVRQKGPQEVDIISMVKPITKFATTVMDPSEIKHTLKKAIHLATSGRRGPVWLDIPLDVQASDIDPDLLENFDPKTIPEPNEVSIDEIDQVIEQIESAERPIILAGHGIRLAQATEPFRALVDQLNVPVVSTWNSMDLIPTSHELMIGKPGTVALRAPNFAVQNADLLISIGARLDNVVTAFNPSRFGRNAKKIVVDIDLAELNKFDHNIDYAIQADAKNFIEKLSQRLPPQRERTDWIKHCNDLKKKYPIADGNSLNEEGEISHFLMVKALSEEFPEDEVIVTGSSGLGVEFFYMGFNTKKGQRVFLTSGLGAMGYGLPAMIGASKALGGRSFTAVESDGSFMMNLQELFTIRSQNTPVRIFLMNNDGYASIRATQRNYFDSRFVGTNVDSGLWIPDPADLAKAAKIDYINITDGSELRSKIRETLAHPGPVICNINLKSDEALWPKSSAIPQEDGGILSMPLEDMSPLLPIEELKQAMLDPLDPVSLAIEDR